uniref:ZP domain-containing protein n=1 Tax=Ascaris lumbricoides TaxID=6252 RepID=A0A0M3I4E0_ASCLU
MLSASLLQNVNDRDCSFRFSSTSKQCNPIEMKFPVVIFCAISHSLCASE